MTPILRREFLSVLRMPRAMVAQVVVAVVFAGLVIARWPTDALVDLSGESAIQVFRLFGYGLLAAILLLAPVFPATSIVRERKQGTLALLLNSPLSPAAIYAGKFAGVMGFVLLLLSLSVPAAAACYAMGAIALVGDLLPLYGVLLLAGMQYVALGLLVSSYAATTDGALRWTYGYVLALSCFTLIPHLFFQGQEGPFAEWGEQLRCLSPLPAVMTLLRQEGSTAQGFIAESNVTLRYCLLAVVSLVAFAVWTILRLNYRLYDQPRAQGVMTEDRGLGTRVARRMFYLVDPQRRSPGIPWFLNPVMIKEFRTRRFGRMYWLLRLVSICALLSLALTYAATAGTIDWGVETIGGILVLLQVTLIVVFTPSLASGLISSERESGGWDLLRTTPLSARRILVGKLSSALWTLALLLLATLPGYVVMIWIKPAMEPQVKRVVVCLLATAGFALIWSAAAGCLFRRTATATTAGYMALLAVCAGPMLVWLGRDAPFSRQTVEAALTIDPLAAALAVIKAPGFETYDLIPANWWALGIMSAFAGLVLIVQTWRLTRPS